ncbi:MAG: hypothetical protein J2P36_26905 [Ktedonobacteraceae bacterium]|nr:hypothetical protein [Ktedonobacteraceae bacterium]
MNDRGRFDKFTERARRALSLAQEEAQRLQHNYIGTEHLLLGLVRLEDGAAITVLKRLGVDLERVRHEIEIVIGRGDRIVLGEVGLTPRAKRVIELAVDEARRLGHHYIDAEHLLLGIVCEGEGIAAGVLTGLRVNLEKVRRETEWVLNEERKAEEGRGNNVAVLGEASPYIVDALASGAGVVGSEVAAISWGQAVNRVFDEAAEEARHWQHDHIGTEHLLLGLLRIEECPATKILQSLGADLSRARSVVITLIGEGKSASPQKIALTPRALELVGQVVREGIALGRKEVTPELLLLVLTRSGAGLALSILGSLGVDLKRLQGKLLQAL